MEYYLNRVGADVEVFLKNHAGEPVPVCGLLGGTKEKPLLIRSYGAYDKYSAVQEDNVMPEFNIFPADNYISFIEATTKVLDHLRAHFRAKELIVDIRASQEFKDEQLKSKQAQNIGCMPDFNAWKLQPNPTINPEIMGNVRTAGGHVHVSFTMEGRENFRGIGADAHQARMIRMLDLYLGVPSVIVDEDVRRKKYYGKAGAYRPKDYGVEYRVLSNFWIKDNNTMEWVYHQCNSAVYKINALFEDGKEGNLPIETCKEVIQCINNNDVEAARKLCKEWGITCP